MKKIIASLLTLVLLFSCTAALADVWYCPEDGTACESNFCPVCGTKRPEVAGGGDAAPAPAPSSDLAVTNAVLNSDGSVSVSWKGGTAPYNLYYTWYANAQHNEGSGMTIFCAFSGKYGNDAKLDDQMVPGERYWIVIEDANGSAMWYDFNPGQRIYTELPGTRMKLSLRTKKGNKSKTVNSFSANEIEQEYLGSLFGGTIKLVLGRGGVGYHFIARMAIILPTGEPLLFHYEDATSRWTECGWETHDFKPVWVWLMQNKGGVAAGQYTFRIYLNDGLFGQDTININ